MPTRRSRSNYVISSLVLSAFLFVIGPVCAENSATIDLSTQPHLKSWSNKIPNAARRFVVLADFNNEAVLDRETGLVWEISFTSASETWANAGRACLLSTKGGRKAWRLPSVVELLSLVDPVNSAPSLPTGHPFPNTAGPFWTATTYAVDPSLAWDVHFNLGGIGVQSKAFNDNVWCVRGPMQESMY